ncbi:hypothetical protein AMTRI_Chr11g101960 [Amborella trichopoda]|uniref:Longin domain-containing protein n=1 Tax=Amborella trichopoda TaxID=13333 RepID=W1NYH9_AMBTC|nr:phytolongin Phyl1.1 [Amborella trichopoda]XP_020519095.1 phytolongin Phyl1.1 [Amborella trichopoda]ERM99734.1 hypothetical protein AMTR_s00099p00108030 [Amborella trichopoda]|eukprot:XP_011620999.1 phytolongin Phyl1.1 [Amborella trichopoda]
MGSVPYLVFYCCISKGNKVVAEFSSGDKQIENQAALCLEKVPPYHIWYFHTIGRRIYGFLMEDGFVYFAITDESVGKSRVLELLEQVRYEFKKISKNGVMGVLGLSPSYHEQMGPTLRHLVSSIEALPQVEAAASVVLHVANQDSQTSTKDPLLGSSNRSDKKMKLKERNDTGGENHVKSVENRGIKLDVDCDSDQCRLPAMSLQKSASMRMREARRNWRRNVCIVLVLDLILCIVLFGIWLGVCKGLSCLSH